LFKAISPADFWPPLVEADKALVVELGEAFAAWPTEDVLSGWPSVRG